MKRWKLLVAAVIGSCIMAGTSYAGQWRLDRTGYWYQRDDGSYPRSEWMKDVDGKWYYFNDAGYVHTGWLVDGDNLYYLDSSGKMLTGQQTVEGSVYRFDPVNGNLLETVGTEQGEVQGLDVNTDDLSGNYGRSSGGAWLMVKKTEYGYIVEGHTSGGMSVRNYMEMISDTEGTVSVGGLTLTLSWVTCDYLEVTQTQASWVKNTDYRGDYYYEGPVN